jgi:hypothetical protein
MNRIVTQKLAPSGTTIDLGVGTTPDIDYDDAANLRTHKIWNGTGTSEDRAQPPSCPFVLFVVSSLEPDRTRLGFEA